MKKQNIMAVGLLLLALGSKAQTISTVAGTDPGGYSGDGGAATAAEMLTPIGVVMDGSGNMYIADQHNNCVRKVNSSGIISTFAGVGTTFGFSGDGGAATDAKMFQPYRVAADASGNVYILDQGNWRIRKVDASGTITTFAGNGTSGTTGDGGPATAAEIATSGLAVDASGNVYFGSGSCIRKVDVSTGIISTIAGSPTISGYSGDGGPATAAQLNDASDLIFDAAGNLYVCCQVRIRKITTSGIISTIAGNGTIGITGDGGPATAASVDTDPSGIAVDASGNIYFAQTNDQIIRKIDAAGIITKYAGNDLMGFSGDGGPATGAEFRFPSQVATDASGAVYIADQNNNRIRKVGMSSSGVKQTTFTNSIVLLPNPSNGTFAIKGSLNSMVDENVSLQVLDMSGQVVYAKTIALKNGSINAQVSLPDRLGSGLYVLRLATGTENKEFILCIEK